MGGKAEGADGHVREGYGQEEEEDRRQGEEGG